MANTQTTQSKGGSKQTSRSSPRKGRRLGSEGAGHKRQGRNRPDTQGRRGNPASNKAGSGQGARKN